MALQTKNFKEILDKYNCKIRPDASPWVVLMPFGPVGFVYEISDVDATESKKQEIISVLPVD